MTKTYSAQVHCINFEIHTNSLKLGNWLEKHFPWYLPAISQWKNDTTYTIYLEELDSTYTMPIENSTDGFLIDTPLGHSHCFYDNNCFYNANPPPYEYQVEYNIQTHTLKANLGGILCEDEQAFLTILMSFFLRNFTLAFHKTLFIHSAVLSKNEKGYMFLGDSGAGKSTTALYFMCSGYSILSDDSPLFTLQNDKSYALCSLDEPRVTPNTLELLPNLKEYLSNVPHHFGKHVIDRHKLKGEQWTTGPVPINYIINLKRETGAELSLKPFNRHEALHLIFKHAMVVFKHALLYEKHPIMADVTEFAFKTITTLVENAQVYTLNYSNEHLKELPEFLEENLLKVPAS